MGRFWMFVGSMRIKVFVLFALMLVSSVLCAQTQEEAKELHEKGRKCLEEGDFIKGREYTKQALDMRKVLLGEKSEDYITSLNNYANSFTLEGNYTKAIELQKRVLELCGELGTPHPNLGMYKTNMGRNYYLNGDLHEAAVYWEQALPLVEKYGDLYEYLLTGLGSVYDETRDMDGLERIMGLMEEHNKHELEKDCDEPECMLERAQYFSATGDKSKAKECYMKALAMRMEDDMKIKVFESYAMFLFGMNDYVSGAEYYVMAANLVKGKYGVTEDYVDFIYKAAVFDFLAGEYEKSIELYRISIDFYSRYDSSVAKKNRAACFKGMGNAYSALKKYDKAEESFEKEAAYYEAEDTTDEEYPKAILRLAKAEKFGGNYEESIKHHKEAMRLFEERGMLEDYADAASSLQLCYVYAGKHENVETEEEAIDSARIKKLDDIIKEELSNINIVRKYLGALPYAHSLATVAGSYMMKADYDSATVYYKQYMEAIRGAIRDEFRLQNESERMAVWQDEIINIEQLQELLVLIPEANEKLRGEMAAVAYDAELLSKGILLKSAIEFERVLEAKKDAELKKIYEQSKANEQKINQLRKQAASDTDIEKIVGLSRQNQALTLRLYKEFVEFADFTDYISYSWKDVQSKLGEKDIAIEFSAIHFGVFDGDNVMVALVLTKDMERPVALRICNEAEAKAMDTDKQLFDANKNLIWSVLAPYLRGKQRIFFSADGSFNHIGIEYLSYNGRPLSEQFEVYRLSSTKELCYQRAKSSIQKAVLFGDINYNDNASVHIKAEVRGSGDGFANLENTLEEVDSIYNLLKADDMRKVIKYTDTLASKKVFLELTDSDVNLLHIATHGVYNDVKGETETESMTHSLLAFAGANLGDEGLVSAAEIATMNLRQCELVVLSACKTGLGKIDDDGVFGLQRGFKNSGVHTLLMSLKNVYDDSTAALMKFFYQGLMKGLSKREALVNAQRDLRNSGFDAPEYWATFILLDAY